MSDRLAAEIKIGGPVRRRLVPKLLDCIRAEGLVVGWEENPFTPKTADELLELAKEGEPRGVLQLVDQEACWGQFGELEAFLCKHQIAFDRRTEAKYQYFPEVAAAIEGELPRRVLILVDGVEHALALAKRLRDWPVICGPDPNTDGLAAADTLLLSHQAVEQFPSHAIATMQAIGDIALQNYDALIRADGGLGLPDLDIDTNFLETFPKSRPRLLLIDFDDLHHHTLCAWSRRQQCYEARNWHLFGTDRLETIFRIFRASRPQKVKRN